jgi:hypothetical protein
MGGADVSYGSTSGRAAQRTAASYLSRMTGAVDARPVAILKASDIRRTEDWYRKAGFVLRAHHPEEAPTWCELEREGTVLQFLSGETPWIEAPSFTGCFYVHCSDVDAVYEQIRDLVEIEWASRIANGERASSCCAIPMDTS